MSGSARLRLGFERALADVCRRRPPWRPGSARISTTAEPNGLPLIEHTQPRRCSSGGGAVVSPVHREAHPLSCGGQFLVPLRGSKTRCHYQRGPTPRHGRLGPERHLLSRVAAAGGRVSSCPFGFGAWRDHDSGKATPKPTMPRPTYNHEWETVLAYDAHGEPVRSIRLPASSRTWPACPIRGCPPHSEREERQAARHRAE
jgi:hypothetical protein